MYFEKFDFTFETERNISEALEWVCKIQPIETTKKHVRLIVENEPLGKEERPCFELFLSALTDIEKGTPIFTAIRTRILTTPTASFLESFGRITEEYIDRALEEHKVEGFVSGNEQILETLSQIMNFFSRLERIIRLEVKTTVEESLNVSVPDCDEIDAEDIPEGIDPEALDEPDEDNEFEFEPIQ